MELVEQIAAAFRKFYSSNAKHSIATLLQSCDILVGGRTDEADLYVEPTVVDAKLNDPILENEIFGPILPVVGVNNMDDAIEFIRSKEKPLAVYLFSTDEKMAEKIKMTTSSGALVLNDAIWKRCLLVESETVALDDTMGSILLTLLRTKNPFSNDPSGERNFYGCAIHHSTVPKLNGQKEYSLDSHCHR
ncbi:Aldehyde dehydrogenase family 3 member B1 [Trichinella pseudospiralis]|uniref:Aldehyde dehydrogenase family 3 member B1 n=1 Tax=Trichinella pseudospiralis TaxID=6337 RepID=A0A0V0Y071_TRIPS|nr:Aldehyde dehydrogenase family 3 member B1 [Trichinella pseudospiralis]